jgi:cell division protein FtsL
MNRARRAVFTPQLPPRLERWTKAYKEAPWQRQQQWIALFLLAVTVVGIVAGVYLNITARAAIAGREIQGLEADIVKNQRINADIETRLGTLLSTEELRRRAISLGYQPVDMNALEYVVVPGYTGVKPLALGNDKPDAVSAEISPEFTQSLFDWLNQQMHTAASQASGN